MATQQRPDLLAMVPASGHEVIHQQDIDFVEGKNFVFENVVCHHACLLKPNTTYKPEWCIVVEVPEAQLQAYLQYGFRIKADTKIGVPCIRCKKATVTNAGEQMDPPAIVDADKVPWTVERGLIGNGSICNVAVKAMYTVDTEGVKAVTCFLNAVQIVDHVPYTGGAVSAFSKVPGNTAGFVPGAQAPPPAQPNPGFGASPMGTPATPQMTAPLGMPAPAAQAPAAVYQVPPQPAPPMQQTTANPMFAGGPEVNQNPVQQQVPASAPINPEPAQPTAAAPAVPEETVNEAIQQTLAQEQQGVTGFAGTGSDIPF